MSKQCKWCHGNISFIRFVASVGYCLYCSLRSKDAQATAPTYGGKRGQNVK